MLRIESDISARPDPAISPEHGVAANDAVGLDVRSSADDDPAFDDRISVDSYIVGKFSTWVDEGGGVNRRHVTDAYQKPVGWKSGDDDRG
jgi:hypothetical protein